MQKDFTYNFNLLNQAVLKSVYTSSEQEIIKNFTDVIIEILNADFGFSFFKDFGEKEFKLIYKDPRTPFEPPNPREKGITQKAFIDKVPVYETDYTKSVWLINKLEQHIKGFVSIPISYQDNNYGTFNICYREEHEFTVEEKSLCVFIGNSAAQAITIYRLLQNEQKARLEAESQHERFRALIENSYDTIAVIDAVGIILDISHSVTRMAGYAPQELLGKNISEFVYEADLAALNEHMQKTLENPDTPLTLEFRYCHKDGSWRWMEATGVNMLDNKDVTGIVVNIRDITERKQSQDTIEHQALHDPLTDLPNRQEFGLRFDQALENAKRSNGELALMFLDLDRFKNINDSLGHSVGDTVLKVIASRFSSCLRGEDVVARFGGDEFLILASEIKSPKDAAIVAEKILKAVSLPLKIDEHTLHPTVSIGIAIYPNDGLTAHSLKQNADAALYRAKEGGRNRFSLYDHSMDSMQAAERLILENEFRQALEEGQIKVYYQPILDLKRRKLAAVEALARWMHPTKGILMPSEFIPLAEETGLIKDLDEYILKQASRQSCVWHEVGLPKFRVAVNMSAFWFGQAGFPVMVANTLKDFGCEGSDLELEITEGTAMANLDLTSANLKELKKLGVRVTIDDFGTGYSSLSYLKRFPIHSLKIDKSFVRHSITNPQDTGITKTIIAMAHALNLKVVAEGVETQQHLDFLQSLGCDCAQGFFIGQPMPAEELLVWLEQKKLNKKVVA